MALLRMVPATLAIILPIVLGLTACDRKGSAPTLTKVSLAASRNLWTAVPIVAKRQGYFREEGLDVSIEYVQAARFAMDAVLSGQANFGTVVEFNLASVGLSGNNDVRLISTIARAYDSGIVARRDAGINAPADLAGKRLGVLTGTTSEIFAQRFMSANGVDPAQVNTRSLQPVAMQTALVERGIDAASIWQPFIHNIARALGPENVVIFRDRNAYTGYMNVAVRSGWLTQNADTTAAFLRAMDRALEFIRTNPEQAQAIVAEEINLELPVVRAIWSEYSYSNRLAVDELLPVVRSEAEWLIKTQPGVTGPAPDFRSFLVADLARSK